MSAATPRSSLVRAGLIVTIAVVGSRILGGLRLAIVTAVFPLGSPGLDSFLAAFTIPDFIFQLVAAGALASALIPIIAGLHAKNEDARAWRVASTVANLMFGTLVVLCLVVLVTAPGLVSIVASGFDPQRAAKTAELTRIMVLSPLFLAAGALATSLLNARDRFGAAAFSPIVYNLGIIGGALVLAPVMGIDGVAIGVVIGSLGLVLVQLRPLWATGFRYRPVVDLSDPDARQALRLIAPRAVGLGASQLTFVVATALLSGLTTGSISAFRLAFSVFQIPFGVIGVPIGIVALPTMSRDLAVGDVGRYVDLIGRAMRIILFVMLPITTLGMALRVPIVEILFNSTTRSGIDETATALLVLLLALPSESLIAILARAFYADRDTTTPVLAAVIAVVINTSVAILTVSTLGVPGVAVGIVLGSVAEACFLVVRLQARTPGFRPIFLLTVGGPTLVAAAVAGGAAYVAQLVVDGMLGAPNRIGVLLELVVAGSVGCLAYLAATWALRIAELPVFMALLRGAVRRPQRS
ncbi:MAG TPA: murein biosynthesis integral membrane protein MurJ [Candidatus Acidoferrum sp.]|nr:murein biosynthesis integral membrane protein MurJ [Candidatus Acidoferrum sp.]